MPPESNPDGFGESVAEDVDDDGDEDGSAGARGNDVRAARLEVKVQREDDDVPARELGEEPGEGVWSVLRAIVRAEDEHEEG